MHQFENEMENKLKMVVCNKCGKNLKIENGYLKEGCFSVDFSFGYFSQKDGMKHKFDLCEECYDSFIAEMSIPVDIIEEQELL